MSTLAGVPTAERIFGFREGGREGGGFREGRPLGGLPTKGLRLRLCCALTLLPYRSPVAGAAWGWDWNGEGVGLGWMSWGVGTPPVLKSLQVKKKKLNKE